MTKSSGVFGLRADGLEAHIAPMLERLLAWSRVGVAVNYETRLAESRRAAEIIGGELKILLEGRCCRVEDVKTYELVS